MDFERELNQMIGAMSARAGQHPNRIIMHPDTARAMVSHKDNFMEAEGYISRYNGIPITLSNYVEPGKFYLVQDSPIYEATNGTDYTAWWLQSPYGTTSTPITSFTLDTYKEKKQEEPDEIDESSFMDILNAGE